MSKFLAIALVAALTASATANAVAGDQTRLRDQSQQRLQDGSCQTVCEGTGPNADCPQYQYQTQTGTSYQWAGPEDDWGWFMWQYFGSWK